MLIRLTSNTSGEMIMLAEHAHRLFHIIGKECTARGVFITEQLPAAIEKLHQAVNDERLALQEAERRAREDHDDADEDPEEKAAREEEYMAGRIGVHLGQRAQPLINLMEWTLKEGGFILWETDKDF
ncbi:MAG: DUF1840 domain-containing protein [Propionivibrio sp.]